MNPIQVGRQTVFLALGGVWLDDIGAQGRTLYTGVLGGSVTFATFGARLFVPQDPAQISLVFIAGKDFDNDALAIFRTWGVNLTVHWRSDLAAARGLLDYGGSDGSGRTYTRLTAPLTTTWGDLTLSDLVFAKSFHLFETPSVLKNQVSVMSHTRAKHAVDERPLIIWEPQPKVMRPDTFQEHVDAAQLVDVFSPNHEELATLFTNSTSTTWDPAAVERQARQVLSSCSVSGKPPCIVIRAAAHGCLVMWSDSPSFWLPAYHTEPEDVVELTGAGNAFLGGFAIGYLRTQSYLEAAIYAQVAASFAIEQVGLPCVTGVGKSETWNGVSVEGRMEEYRKRIPMEADEWNSHSKNSKIIHWLGSNRH